MSNPRFLLLLAAAALTLTTFASGQTTPSANDAPLRVAIAGLVHGHVAGFLKANLHRSDIELVGIAEPDRALVAKYSAQYHINSALFFMSLEETLEKTHPQAVLAYTTTYDHREVVEICARHGVAVMMEKPLSTSYEDALAIQQAATKAKIAVLVNYETTWYRSNRAAYELVAIRMRWATSAKSWCTMAIAVPRRLM